MKVLHHDPHEHVEHEEANQQQERDEVDEPPLVEVLSWLSRRRHYGHITIEVNYCCLYLLVYSDGVEPLVHDVDPSVLGGQDEEGHERLAEVVEVVLVVDPLVAVGSQLQALSLVRHQFGIRTLAVVEDAFK